MAIEAIVCERLRRVFISRTGKSRREVVALDDLNLSAPSGTVLGILGPNGAGKTTAVRILSTLLTPTEGRALVLGHDVVKQAGAVRREIGLVFGGDLGFYGRLTGRENLRYFAAINQLNPHEIDQLEDELLRLVGLTDGADRPVQEYSRGMKQRLHIARSLITDPSVLFLDEPTIGLDPFGAQEVRELIPRLVARGKTVLMTTHYMFEADLLCHTIALINRGRLLAYGTPTEIKQKFSHLEVLEIGLRHLVSGLEQKLSAFEDTQRVDVKMDETAPQVVVQIRAGANLDGAIKETIGEDNIVSVQRRDPTLEEAYLSILR